VGKKCLPAESTSHAIHLDLCQSGLGRSVYRTFSRGLEVAATVFWIQLRSSVSQWPERVKYELQSSEAKVARGSRCTGKNIN